MEYLVNIFVHELAGLSLKDSQTLPSPQVVVQVLGQQRQTEPVHEAGTCRVGQFFSIAQHVKPREFLRGDVEVLVYNWSRLGFSAVIGAIVISLRQVYAQPEHIIQKSWFPLCMPETPGEPVGFIQLTLGAYGQGDGIPRSAGGALAEEDEVRSLRGRVVAHPSNQGAMKNIHLLLLRIHQAEGLRLVAGAFSEGCDPLVRVEFNGIKQETATLKNQTSPSWQTEVRVPFLIPAWDDSVNVRLFCASGATVGETLLGDICLHIEDLKKPGGLAPTWSNFYYSPEVPESDGPAFGGRLLLSAQIERTETPIVTKCAAPAVREPPCIPHLLRVDLYEMCFDCQPQPDRAQVLVSFAPFLDSREAKGTTRQRHAFVWQRDAGRMEEECVMLPPTCMCSDLVINALGDWGGSMQPFMYLRIPVPSLLQWNSRPQWYDCRSVRGGGSGHDKAGCVLMSVGLGPQDGAPPREPRESIKLQSYRFRVLLFRGLQLPAMEKDGLTNPLVVIFFGSAMLQSKAIADSVNPCWDEVLEQDVELPDKSSILPDITLYVLHAKTDGPSEPVGVLRYPTRERGLPQETAQPAWFDLGPAPNDELAGTSRGRVLVAFELRPPSTSLPQSIAPPSVKCRAEVFVIGVRSHLARLQLRNPKVMIRWGHESAESGKKKRQDFTRNSPQGANGHFNFLETLKLDCEPARDPDFQDVLEVKLLSEREDGRGDIDEVAFGSLHLAPFLPWLPPGVAKASLATCRPACKQDDGREGERSRPKEADGVDGRPAGGELTAAGWGPEAAAFLRGGQLTEDLELSNARVLLGPCQPTHHANLTEEDDRACVEFLRAEESRICERLVEEVDAAESLHAFCKDFSWQDQHGGQWDALDQHPDLDSALEGEQLPPEELPYVCIPLIVGSESGVPTTLATLKCCCRVVERAQLKSPSPQVREEGKAWERRIQAIESEFGQADDLVIRAYILSADCLTPTSGSSDCSTYVWSNVAGHSDSSGFRDRMTTREHTLHPRFNTVHSFPHCRFPDNALARISVVDVVPASIFGAASEEAIGSTTVDLEDRWFHARYRKMVQDGAVPIEARHLHSSGSTFSSGHLRLWIDLFTAKEAQEQQIAQLPSAEPRDFELRVVIWRVTDIEHEEGKGPDICVSGQHTPDDKVPIERRTDTHLNADDGIGTFNYRLLFNLKIPCADPRLLLRVLWDGWMEDTPIAEVTLDLAQDFEAVHQRSSAVEFPREQVRMMHPTVPGKVAGTLELEARIVPAAEALINPVGSGQEKPNEDPFLDPDDPHRLRHREMFRGLREAMLNVGGGLFKGLMMGTMIYVAGGAIVGLVSTGFSLYLLFK